MGADAFAVNNSVDTADAEVAPSGGGLLANVEAHGALSAEPHPGLRRDSPGAHRALALSPWRFDAGSVCHIYAKDGSSAMFIATCVLSAVLAALLVLSAYGKLTRNPEQTATIVKVGFPERYIWLLASCELAAAAGIVLGLFWWPIGIAAGIGAVLYFVLAVASHLRRKMYDVQSSGAILLLSVAVLVLRALTI
ncbi:DoxX family protein [Mycobacterium sp.]|uniref:DoxX family protein n=1 Tax=Mycobacterium sp. TaxID=1785 RepID=UPI003D103A9B